jgi:hypothetical protein
MLRWVTQPPHIAGPLAKIFQYLTISHRAVFNKFCLDKIFIKFLPEPAPRSTDNQPSRLNLPSSFIRLTILPFIGTLPSRDEQILVLTESSTISSNYLDF